MTDDEIEMLIGQEVTQAEDYIYGPDNIAAERDRNYDYCRGIMLDLPAPPDRSKVVEMVVANYIGLIKPQLLRIFTSGRDIVQYVSSRQELQGAAKLITRYINDVVFRKDNRGELLLNDWADDALVQKLGVVMWYWEEAKEARDEVRENLTDEDMLAVAALVQAGQIELLEAQASEVDIQAPDGTTFRQRVHAVKVRTWENKSKCCIDTIPPEEFKISRDARTLEDAVLKGHETGVMVGDLVRQGFPFEEVESLPTWTDSYPDRTNRLSYGGSADSNRASSADPMLRKVGVLRGILRCNRDGTGLKDWFFIAAGTGSQRKLLDIQPYNEQVGFADFCPEPVPHTVYGRCPADRLAPLQKIRTVLIRQINDNLFLSNTPQREVVMDNIVKPDQLMNFAPGAPVLVKAINSIREIQVPFVAGPALEAIKYYDSEAELTSGVSRMSAGLDPEVLQNQSATAAANQQSAMTGRIEATARIWAQGGMRKLFRGVFRCLKNYQDFERIVQIDGATQKVDPRAWEGLDDLDININTGLGTGNRAQEFSLISAVQMDQEKVIAALGPNNPVVTPSMAIKTMQMKAQAGGFSNPEVLFRDPGENFQIPPPAAPQPSPDALVFAETEKFKAQIKVESDERVTLAKMENDRIIALRKAELEYALKERELGIKQADVLVSAAKVDADAKKDRAA